MLFHVLFAAMVPVLVRPLMLKERAAARIGRTVCAVTGQSYAEEGRGEGVVWEVRAQGVRLRGELDVELEGHDLNEFGMRRVRPVDFLEAREVVFDVFKEVVLLG